MDFLAAVRFVACNLRNDGRYRGIECEMLVFDEEATHAPEVDTGKEILDIRVEHKRDDCDAP